MAVTSLDKLFKPKSIAVIGASDSAGSAGAILLRNLLNTGYQGNIYVITEQDLTIQEVQTYPALSALPERVDLAIINSPATSVPEVVQQCGQAGITGILIISSGFQELGTEGMALQDELKELKTKYNLHIIGPASLGIIHTRNHLNATTSTHQIPSGSIAVISQSDALSTAMLNETSQLGCGLSYFISLGAMVDADFGDLVNYLGTDPEITSILLNIESMTDAHKFMSAARRYARSKPILVAKSGRFSDTRQAGVSQSRALARDDLVYDAAFKRAGLVRVDEARDLFIAAEALGKAPLPKGSRLVIITNAAGPSMVAMDALVTDGGSVAALAQSTLDQIKKVLPPYWQGGNPIDLSGDADAKRYQHVIDACLTDENVDGVLVIYTGQVTGIPIEIAQSIITLNQRSESGKPILAALLGSESAEKARQLLAENQIAAFATPEQAVKAFLYLGKYQKNLEQLVETPEVSSDLQSPRLPLMTLFKNTILENRNVLTETEAKTVLVHCKIPAVTAQIARTQDEALALASRIGYPVVLKVVSPQITLKTDAGGVVLNIQDQTALTDAFTKIMTNAQAYDPKATIEGVSVQQMITEEGYELFLGAQVHPAFGPVILFGMGGVDVEFFQDISVGLPPLNEALARQIIEATKVYNMLQGRSNKPPANLTLLTDILLRFSQMLVDFPQITEVDINPLFINDQNAYALDARIVIDSDAVLAPTPLKAQLVINPYPTRYDDFLRLRNNQDALIRAIKPSDDTNLLAMFQNSSEDTKENHFFATPETSSREAIVGYCNIDYDRELGLVAELEVEGQRQIAGYTRILVDTTGKTGELALIVADPWSGQGVDTKLLANILAISKDQELDVIYAKLRSNNDVILEVITATGFEVETAGDELMLLPRLY
ncbi:MAG: acetate--CoA ligase family protein [Candidatus Bathyarchaeota archaeon]|nr:MAG: acetate--CoA ligase family protein [Candidatus Bathyarchaeota archaeon]